MGELGNRENSYQLSVVSCQAGDICYPVGEVLEAGERVSWQLSVVRLAGEGFDIK
jgi:hypothetical protein